MKKIFYEKIGRKYVPVSEYNSELLDSYPKGSHLIMSVPGGISRRYNIDPAYAAMIAAGRVAEDVIRKKIYEASEAQPKRQPLTPRQRAAWQEIKLAYGDEFFSLTLPSSHTVAEAGVKAMQEEAMKLLANPAAKKAYEHFMLVCELTKETKYE